MSSSRNCDALFVKGAWNWRFSQAKTVRTRPPVGWQHYREQLWSNKTGQLRYNLGNLRLRICHGDILEHLEGADAVVNSANKNLAGPYRPEYWMFSSHAGQSVEEVIHKAAGPDLQEACNQLDCRYGEGIRCPVGKARATSGTASLLPSGFIVHTVAPGWHSYATSAPLLKSSWSATLDAVAELGVEILVVPALGCGTNRAPLDDAAACAFETLKEWGQGQGHSLEVRLVLHSFETWVSWTDVAFDMYGK